MTNAILFNNERGSGREVTVTFVDAGIELLSIGGEQIAIWPYGAIDSPKGDLMALTNFRLDKHDGLTLQVFDDALSREILARAPRARRARWERFLDTWVPAEVGAAVYIGGTLLVVWAGTYVFGLWH